ncbi:MAG TPA: TlpA disulfide reductase family protein [Dyella sp.]|nr:TlpA disulfide reductase family protein [Dyella sp.]
MAKVSMRSAAFLLALMCLSTATCAGTPSADEQHFVATLQLGASPQVRYLDANGKPLDYADFAQQLQHRRSYSMTGDRQAGVAVLRLRPAGAHAGEPGRFAFGHGDAFAPFELPSLHGGVQRLKNFRGRYTLVSFFFAECAPCIAEVPTLNAYAAQHRDMNFVAVTFEDATSAQQFVTAHDLTWNVLYHGESLTDTLGIGVYPTLMLIDPEGRVAGAAVGMTMSDDPAKRLADLGGWIEQWQRVLPRPQP